ncbi:MAG: hypothetical protein KDD02_07860 [Phaeodactylibacter sp.]|nr:hypothetical protein [Phaeodactylibacter sp.]MCB9302636.1 hypothetical protein [Lewinellaceae bacterium]
MSRVKRRKPARENRTDITKRPIALILPYVITGLFGIVSIFFTWWLNRDENSDSSSGKGKKLELNDCELKGELRAAIGKISKTNSNKSIDYDDKLFLSAVKEKFESYLSNPEICSDKKISETIMEELEVTNEIISNE